MLLIFCFMLFYPVIADFLPYMRPGTGSFMQQLKINPDPREKLEYCYYSASLCTTIDTAFGVVICLVEVCINIL